MNPVASTQHSYGARAIPRLKEYLPMPPRHAVGLVGLLLLTTALQARPPGCVARTMGSSGFAFRSATGYYCKAEFREESTTVWEDPWIDIGGEG